MDQIIRIGMDTSKHFFQLHGVNAAEQPVLRRKLRRNEVLAFFAKLPPTVIGMEACGAGHYWARELRKLGHEVRLMAPQHVKAYVKRNKNDGRDAEGLCEAMGRPTMQFVAVKTEEQQAALMLAGVRQQLITRRTQLSNAIRGHAAEFGLITAKGLDKIEPLLERIAQDQSVPELAREMFAMQGRSYARLQVELKAIEVKLLAWHRANADSRRLTQIPGVGPIGATALVMKTSDPHAFASGRHFAAWLGPFHRRQDQARQDHPRRRRDVAQRAGGGSNGRDPTGEARSRPCVALAARAAGAQAAEARRGGARQQDCPHRLEADGDGRKLRRCADAWRIGARRLRDQPVGRFAEPAEPELQEEIRW
jgi:transposase